MLGDREQKTYIGTFSGNFTRKAKAGDMGVIERENKANKIVKEIHFNNIEAKLVDIVYKDSDYGRQVQFMLKDGDENYVLQTGVKSKLATLVINRLPVLNFKKKIEFNIGYTITTDKVWYSLAQGGDNIDDYFNEWDDVNKTYILKHGIPKWEQIEVNGEMIWNASKQMAFQEKVVAKYIDEIRGEKPIKAEPKKEMPDQAHHGEPVTATATATAEKDEEEDDLPF